MQKFAKPSKLGHFSVSPVIKGYYILFCTCNYAHVLAVESSMLFEDCSCMCISFCICLLYFWGGVPSKIYDWHWVSWHVEMRLTRASTFSLHSINIIIFPACLCAWAFWLLSLTYWDTFLYIYLMSEEFIILLVFFIFLLFFFLVETEY